MDRKLGRLMLRGLISLLFLACSSFALAGTSSVVSIAVKDLPPAELFPHIIAGCLQRGMAVVETTDYQVVCSAPMDDSMRSLFIRALATPSYSTNPVLYSRVTAVSSGGMTTVAAEEYFQYQNAYGQVKTIPVTNKKSLAATRAGLEQMKANWESRSESAVVSPTAAAEPKASPAPAQSAYSRPSAAQARQALVQAGCPDDFQLVGTNGPRTVFSGLCTGGRRQMVECKGMTCAPLR